MARDVYPVPSGLSMMQAVTTHLELPGLPVSSWHITSGHHRTLALQAQPRCSPWWDTGVWDGSGTQQH